MKKKTICGRALPLLVFLCLFCFLLVSCKPGGEQNPQGGDDPGKAQEPGTYRVMLSADEHITVAGENPRRVGAGESVSFSLSFAEGYVFSSASDGVYQDGVLTLGDVRRDSVITVFSVSVTQATFYEYDANGGVIHTDTENAKSTDYRFVQSAGSLLTVMLRGEYLSSVGVLSTFWNDGTFTRDGYVLKEYNTEKDGSGKPVSLGAKYCAPAVNGQAPRLYCIWEEADASDFSTKSFSYPRPGGVSKANSPEWRESGLIITGYTGSRETVAIPDTIGGVPVTAIASGAFTDHTEMKTLILPRFLLKAESGAVRGCSSLETLIYSDGAYDVPNDFLDAASAQNLRHLTVNATIAPRYAASEGGAFGYKLAKLLRTASENRVIVIAGSSAYQGLGTKYLEALLGDYTVINLGTTRTTHGTIYLEAMRDLAHEGDIILYAPENSIYMLGERELYWKTLMNLESCYNYFASIDISRYTNVFGAFSDFNKSYRYKMKVRAYEDLVTVKTVTPDGDYQKSDRMDYCTGQGFVDSYYITLNERVKSKDEGAWDNVENQKKNKDYTDPQNPTWVSLNDPAYASLVNAAFDAAKSSGAGVYFSFSPVDASKLVAGADGEEWLKAYDKLILDTYHIDGILGSCKNYIFAHEYFYDCAFHLNDYGRTWRTYRVYRDLCTLLGRTAKAPDGEGRNFVGCLFEYRCGEGIPQYPVTPKP